MQTLEQLMAAQRAKELRARYAKIMADPATLSPEEANTAAVDAANLYARRAAGSLADRLGATAHAKAMAEVLGGGLASLGAYASRPNIVDRLTKAAASDPQYDTDPARNGMEVMKRLTNKLPKATPEQIAQLAKAIGTDVQAYAVKRYLKPTYQYNALYMPPTFLQAMARDVVLEDYDRYDKDKVKSTKGAIFYDKDMANPAILAHEFGHAKDLGGNNKMLTDTLKATGIGMIPALIGIAGGAIADKKKWRLYSAISRCSIEWLSRLCASERISGNQGHTRS